eukprot:TRINITY_DN6412_c0_g2_i1.p1 TRINITY_DN6412_c0_g2~~TRINITY_DN6412_c0_g2_i1.p1  ORF type:complete len:244 (-),score=59.71 TRINITY_DN6412_c0_g2_i1:65-796(-)
MSQQHETRALEKRTSDDSAPLTKKLQDLYALIDGIQFCMMTTRRSDGNLVSRAMASQTNMNGTDLWFFANIESHKFDEINFDNHVNLSYFGSDKSWVSVAGTAKVSQDREKIKEMYTTDLRAWFPDLEDGVHDGSPSDPRIALILVEANSVTYSKSDASMPVKYFLIAKSIITGEAPNIQKLRHLEKSDLEAGRDGEKKDDALRKEEVNFSSNSETTKTFFEQGAGGADQIVTERTTPFGNVV